MERWESESPCTRGEGSGQARRAEITTENHLHHPDNTDQLVCLFKEIHQLWHGMDDMSPQYLRAFKWRLARVLWEVCIRWKKIFPNGKPY